MAPRAKGFAQGMTIEVFQKSVVVGGVTIYPSDSDPQDVVDKIALLLNQAALEGRSRLQIQLQQLITPGNDHTIETVNR